MISSALTTSSALKERNFNDLAKLLPEPPTPAFVKNAPGYGDLTLPQYKALPEHDRRYLSYVFAARQLGEKPMSIVEYDKMENKSKDPTTAFGVWLSNYRDKYGKNPPESELVRVSKLFKTPAVQVNLDQRVKTVKATTKAKAEVKAQTDVSSPEFVAKIEKKYNPNDVYFAHSTEIDKLQAKYKITNDEATRIYQHALMRQDADRQIRQAYKDQKVSYIKGKGWYVKGKLILRDF